MAQARKKSPSNIDVLARQYGEERWREVIRLFVAMAPRSLFETFMTEVIANGRLRGRHDVTSVCLREAAQPSEVPFKAALASPEQRYEALQALTVLRDLNPEPMRRLAQEFAAQPKKLFGVPVSHLSVPERELAGRLFGIAEAATSHRPVTPRNQLSVFISYSNRDRAAVDWLRAELDKADIGVWHDTAEVKPGDVISKQIESGITSCSHFLPIMSPNFRASRWTEFEEDLAWQRALDEGRMVIVPILLGGEIRSLPARYRSRRFIDLRKDRVAGVAELIRSLRAPATPANIRINPIDGSELVLIPAGTFKVGDRKFKDNPPREMELPAFYLSRNLVTNAQYKKYLTDDSKAEKPLYWDDERFNQPEQPVVGVSAIDAEGYCKWAGRLRLPTEWEWEKGARGTDGRGYPWGEQTPTKELANFGMNVGQTTPVGSFPKGASPYGLMDMAGNVWEWTDSRYRDGSVARTLRGGSFGSFAAYLRAAYRIDLPPDHRYDHIGFRCAQDP